MDGAGKQFVLNSVCAVSQVRNIEKNYTFELDEKMNIVLNLSANFRLYKTRSG